jgi:hypothetical protein
MSNIKNLDSVGSLERIFNRDYNSQKFVIACYLDNKNNNLATYISDDLTDMELTYLIQTLKDRRDSIFNNDLQEG